jgi:nucleoside-diphosphate-sugar epimerase
VNSDSSSEFSLTKSSLYGRSALIIGGSGFLGAHLCKRLESYGVTCTIVDRMPQHSDLQCSKFLQTELDLLSLLKLKSLLTSADFVFYLAGISSIKEAELKPVDAFLQNCILPTECFRLISEFAISNRKQYFFYASSIYASVDSVGYYSASKKAAEATLTSSIGNSAVCLLLGRVGSVYGSWTGSSNLVQSLTLACLESTYTTLPSVSPFFRRYLYIDDIITQIIFLIAYGVESETPINFVGPVEYSLEQLIATIEAVVGRRLLLKEQVESSERALQYSRSCADVHHLFRNFRYTPLDSAVKRMVSFELSKGGEITA